MYLCYGDKTSKKREWERFRCWREIDIAKEESNQWAGLGLKYSETNAMKRVCARICKKRAARRKRKRVTALERELDRSCGKERRTDRVTRVTSRP